MTHPSSRGRCRTVDRRRKWHFRRASLKGETKKLQSLTSNTAFQFFSEEEKAIARVFNEVKTVRDREREVTGATA